MPEARHRCRSSSVAWAVMAMIGKLAKQRSALRWAVAWKPSISGIWRSINTRSNGGGCGPSERICTPSRPLPATRTVAPAPSSSSTAICWLISLSSTRRIRARRGVVVDHEHAEPREAFGDDPARGPGGAQLEPGGEGERAARPGLALQPDASAHQLDEPPRDREPEPGAAVLARGGHVGLGEGLEEAGRLLSGHADPGVAHGELQLDLVAGALEQTDREPDLATLGELHRVVDQVGEDLSETERVTAQVLGDRARDVGEELQPLVVGLLGGERDDRADDLVDLEVRGLEVELARLDLREVEDVVDDAE